MGVGGEVISFKKEKKCIALSGHVGQFQGENFLYACAAQPPHSIRFKGKGRRPAQPRARESGSDSGLRIYNELHRKEHELTVSFWQQSQLPALLMACIINSGNAGI